MASDVQFFGVGLPAVAANLSLQEWMLLAGVIVMLVGTVAQWQYPRRRMSAEEAVKDGKLTEMGARRRIGVLRVLGPTLIVIGGGLMIWAASRMM